MLIKNTDTLIEHAFISVGSMVYVQREDGGQTDIWQNHRP